jgi:predicted ATPase/serine/threonine protein kinase
MTGENSPDYSTQLGGSSTDHLSAKNVAKEGLCVGAVLKGRYLIEKELGRGGIGVVYLGCDQQLLSRLVVIKVLLDESHQNDWLKKKFRLEVEALARIDHPNVVGVFDAGEMSDGKLYLVMQFVAGTDLRSAMKVEGMDFERVAHIIRQTGQAISAAHDKGVYHRDLKPENIMLNGQGEGEEQVKIIDFGIASVKNSQVATYKETTAIAGTIGYMAPEQLMGKPSASSDIYALGVISYEMLTGRRPFNPDSPYQLLEMQRAGVKVKPVDLRPSLEEAAQHIILKSLSFDPGDRYSRARDFGEELARALTSDERGRIYNKEPRFLGSTLVSVNLRRSNLPLQPTSLIGREAESTAVEELLRHEEVRLVTLTGAGGSGKTRLGLHVAEHLINEFENGVCFVSLAALSDTRLVASEIAQALGLREAGGNSLDQILKEYLRDKRMLLVLDNFEHVISAAPLVAGLMAACPKLKILVSSRAALHLRGEHEFVVPPLALPDLKHLPSTEELTQYPGVALFIQRARAIKLHFGLTNENARAVAEICTRLDGLPLAIELAAARIKLLSPQAILARLDSRIQLVIGEAQDSESRSKSLLAPSLQLLTGGAQDLPARQQTMRGTIAWSYDLLDEDEKKLFRNLAVFIRGFTLEAAESLCGETSDLQLRVLDGVSSLVDNSLLRQDEHPDGESRFVMLETIRQYGLECLLPSGEADEIRHRHAGLFLSLAEEIEPELKGAQQSRWLKRLEDEHDNMRGALRWAMDNGELEDGLRMAGALGRFWEVRGHLSEGRRWLEGMLSEGGTASPLVRAKALNGAGILARSQGDYGRAGTLLEQGLSLSQESGDELGIGTLLNILGLVAHDHGDYERAVALNEESLAIKRKLGDKRGIAISLSNLGRVAYDQGDYERASALYAECLALFREVSDVRSIALALNNLGNLAQSQGDPKRAMTLFAESLDLFREMGDKRNISVLSFNMGDIARYEGNYEQATGLYVEGLMLSQELGDKVVLTACLLGLANLICAQGQAERAARLFGAEEVLRETIGAHLSPSERSDYDHNVAIACGALSKEAFAAAWEEGRAMTLQQAIAYALEGKSISPNQPLETYAQKRIAT